MCGLWMRTKFKIIINCGNN